MTAVRLFGIGLYASNAMELSGLGLRAGGVDLTATAITASHSPVSGSLESLLDADLHTGCTFAAADVASPGFFIDITVLESSADAVRIGSGADIGRFVRHLSMGVVEAGRISQPMTLDEIDWPGAHASVVAGGGDGYFYSVALLVPMHADLLDKGPGSVAVSKQGAGAIAADSNAWGGSALMLDGSTGLYTATAAPWTFLHDNTTPYTVEIDFFYSPSSGGQALVCTSVTSGNAGFFLGVLPSGAPYCTMYKGDGVAVLRADASKAATAGTYNTLKLTCMRDRSLRMELNGEIVFSGLWPIESGSWDTFAQGAPVNALCVGAGRLNGNWLAFAQGRMCELRISKMARPSAAKVAAFPTAGSQGVHTPTLLVSEQRGLWLSSEVGPVQQGLQKIDGHRADKLLDTEFGGAGRIYGTVSRKSTPANVSLSRRVRLHRSVDGYLARETWSKADGTYEFQEINPRYEYDVIAWDHERQEFSTVANNQLAEVMP